MSGEYAHDAHCNTAHTAGPEPCPPATSHRLPRAHEAAACHGMAMNPGRPVDERLALALQALRLYEEELEATRRELAQATEALVELKPLQRTDALNEERYQHELTQAELQQVKERLDGAEAEILLLRGDLDQARHDLETVTANAEWLAQRYDEAQRSQPTAKEWEKIRKVAGVEHDV